MDSPLSLAFPTLFGLEEVLAAELPVYDVSDIATGRRIVTGRGNWDAVYRCNLHLRTALRVLINIDQFRVDREQELYDRLRATNWRQYLKPEGSLYVQVVDPGRWFRSSQYIAQLTKDAIVDQFRDKYQTRPSVSKNDPDLRIHLQIGREGEVNLSVDSSGAGLHRRGYRRRTGSAPINEVLAAGMLQLAGYDGEQTFVDPMCGSGTLLVEAASMATRQPPGLFRNFGFERWPNFRPDDWALIRQAALDGRRKPPRPIHGNDIDGVAVAISKATLDRASLLSEVALSNLPFEELIPPDAEPGLLVFNPPYELRMETGDIESFYQMMGDTLKQHWAGYTAWLISANLAAVKRVGLRTTRKIPLMNGPVETRFCRYDLYTGSAD
jgi:putative N6-adenine-specific DNA methylase